MSPQANTPSPTKQRMAAPRLWLVLGDKQGDNGQVRTIAEALGWPTEIKHIEVQPRFVVAKPKVGPTLYHIDRAKSDALEPPWPDLIITVGRRPANVALWIRQESGHQTKIVLVGKPSGMIRQFDLIVASGENQFPPLQNVLKVLLPLMQVDEDGVAAASASWRERFAAFPRPLIGIMVGGPTNPFVFNRKVIDRLIEVADSVARVGGTPYVTTSRRTPESVARRLSERLPSSARIFVWDKQTTDNPYFGLMGLADGIVVTGDSISMMVEAARLRKPLAILPLPTGILGRLDHLRRAWARWLFAPADHSTIGRIRAAIAQIVYRSGFIRHTRDFRAFHQMLVDRGLAVWAGDGFPAPSGEVPDDAALVAQRIRQLMDAADR